MDVQKEDLQADIIMELIIKIDIWIFRGHILDRETRQHPIIIWLVTI